MIAGATHICDHSMRAVVGFAGRCQAAGSEWAECLQPCLVLNTGEYNSCTQSQSDLHVVHEVSQVDAVRPCITTGRGAAHGQLTGRGVRSFYASTIIGRLFLAAVFAAIVAAGELQPALLVLAAVNLLGAASMALALQRPAVSFGGQRIDL